jgi:hypothetical protein
VKKAHIGFIAAAARWVLAVLAGPLLLGAAGLAAGAEEAPKPGPVLAPFYDDTLFMFYQDHVYDALTGLMASQHFGRVSPHDDEAEVLRGGMLLSYGLHDEAATVFDRLIARNAAPSVRNRAWYLLAKMRHQRGLGDAAAEALARIDAPLGDDLEEERQLLQAQLLLERNQFVSATAVLEKLGKPDEGKGFFRAAARPSTAVLYARFNLAVALVRNGDLDRGMKLLTDLGRVAGPNEEVRSLRDRANVARGFAALQAGQPREARLALQNVRLSGVDANMALLGYGWAALQLNDPKLALLPWTELAGRGGRGRADDISSNGLAASGSDVSILEARIAVPYALSEMGSYGLALNRYQRAVHSFEAEDQALVDSMVAVRAGTMVRALLAQNPSDGFGGLARIGVLPEMPHAAPLAPVLAGHEFQESFKNLRDLLFADDRLRHWQQELGTFDDMLANRRRAFAERLPAVRAQWNGIDVGATQQRREALAAELERAEAQRDAEVFADERERDLLQRVQRARATLAALAEFAAAQSLPVGNAPSPAADAEWPAIDIDQLGERLRRAAGALTWQLDQDFPARRWTARKALRDADAELALARSREAAVLQAEADEPLRHDAFAARIRDLRGRLEALLPRIAELDAATRQQMQDIAVAGLQAQQQQLVDYMAQARLAIAQIHDRAQLARRNDAAAPAAEATR